MARSLTSAIKRSIDVYGSTGAVVEEALSSIHTVHAFNLLHQASAEYDHVMTVFSRIIMDAMGLGQAEPSLQEVVSTRTVAFNRESKINPSSDEEIKSESVRGEIELQRVSFRCPSPLDVAVCDNYSLRIASSQQIVFVGSSGRSTIVSLIERFYNPNSGKVTLDGHDLKVIHVGWLWNQIGLVGQEPTLFADTITASIAHEKPGATEQEIINAAKQANAFTFISAFPDGLQTQVGEHGLQLSGGQKQRIAIARAILRDPEVLLLDEATSALDNESEHVVQESPDRLLALKKRTTVVVTHRLTTIRNADIIAVAHEGQIIKQDTHDVLMKTPNGRYRALVTRQIRETSGTSKPQ